MPSPDFWIAGYGACTRATTHCYHWSARNSKDVHVDTFSPITDDDIHWSADNTGRGRGGWMRMRASHHVRWVLRVFALHAGAVGGVGVAGGGRGRELRLPAPRPTLVHHQTYRNQSINLFIDQYKKVYDKQNNYYYPSFEFLFLILISLFF